MARNEMSKREAETPARVERSGETPVYVPRVDISETDTEITLVADMPGTDEQSVDIDLEGTTLTITGRVEEESPEGYSLTYQEYRGGAYERTFTLGNEIDRSGIEASVKDGVLRLRLPKAKEEQPRRIEVKAG